MNIILVNMMHDRADYNRIIVIIHKTYVMSKARKEKRETNNIFSFVRMFHRRCNLSIQLTHVTVYAQKVCAVRVHYVGTVNMFISVLSHWKENLFCFSCFLIFFFFRFAIIVARKFFAIFHLTEEFFFSFWFQHNIQLLQCLLKERVPNKCKMASKRINFRWEFESYLANFVDWLNIGPCQRHF